MIDLRMKEKEGKKRNGWKTMSSVAAARSGRHPESPARRRRKAEGRREARGVSCPRNFSRNRYPDSTVTSRISLLGVPIDAVTAKDAVWLLRGMLDSDRAHHVMTPNNEMLVEASKNPLFKNLLNRSALNLPDSQGLLFAARLTGQRLPERVTGVDTVTALCEQLDERHPVFLLGAGEGIAEKASDHLQAKNPRLKIVGTFSGNPRPEYSEEIVRAINAAQPSLLLVAFGAPAQDVWIDEYLPKLRSVRVAMGVGGTLDFLAGVKKRAPVFFQKFGLEWLYRFVQEPSRYRRMWRAVVVFPWLLFKETPIFRLIGEWKEKR